MSYLIGIDAGTTSVKTVLFSSSGNELAIESIENTVVHPHSNYSEQDMDLLWDNTKKTLQAIIKKSGINPKDIIGIGLTGQGEGCWLLDNMGHPIRNAILWNDTRATDIVSSLSEEHQKKIKDINGSVPSMGRTPILLSWLAKNEEHILKKAKYCISCKDWIRYKLTGTIACEITDASAGILDLKTKKVSQEIFQILGIEEYYSLIPEIIESNSVAGYTTEEIEKECSLIKGIPVSAGFMDVVACPIGMGATHLGDVNTILGTACINGIISPTFNTFIGYSGYTFFGDSQLYLCLIGSMAGMPNIAWLKSTLLEAYQKNFDDEQKFFEFIDNQISSIPVGSNHVIYHPYIKEAGERAPFRNPNAKASFFGISEHTSLWHIVKSVYEGIAFSIKDCLQGFTPNRLFLSGGGAKSKQLTQIIADCLGIPVITHKTKELGAKGAAISVGIATGYFTDFQDANQKFHSNQILTIPNLKNTKKYNELYQLYYDIRIQQNLLWDKRANIISHH